MPYGQDRKYSYDWQDIFNPEEEMREQEQALLGIRNPDVLDIGQTRTPIAAPTPSGVTLGPPPSPVATRQPSRVEQEAERLRNFPEFKPSIGRRLLSAIPAAIAGAINVDPRMRPIDPTAAVEGISGRTAWQERYRRQKAAYDAAVAEENRKMMGLRTEADIEQSRAATAAHRATEARANRLPPPPQPQAVWENLPDGRLFNKVTGEYRGTATTREPNRPPAAPGSFVWNEEKKQYEQIGKPAERTDMSVTLEEVALNIGNKYNPEQVAEAKRLLAQKNAPKPESTGADRRQLRARRDAFTRKVTDLDLRESKARKRALEIGNELKTITGEYNNVKQLYKGDKKRLASEQGKLDQRRAKLESEYEGIKKEIETVTDLKTRTQSEKDILQSQYDELYGGEEAAPQQPALPRYGNRIAQPPTTVPKKGDKKQYQGDTYVFDGTQWVKQ